MRKFLFIFNFCLVTSYLTCVFINIGKPDPAYQKVLEQAMIICLMYEAGYNLGVNVGQRNKKY